MEQTRAAVLGPVESSVRPLIGCDELREWLIAQGFRVAHDSLTRDDECNWYAYRRSGLPARECECNDGKPMQILVRPFKYRHPSTMHPGWQSAEVDVTGEAGGVWFKLQAYSLKHDELQARLGDIERSLIAAWNSLRPNVGIEPPKVGSNDGLGPL
jgi:hypothetical protein